MSDFNTILMNDLKQAMRDKDAIKKDTITMIRSSIKSYEVDNRVEATEEVFFDILSKQLKQKKDSLTQFKDANREDLIEQTNKEINIVLSYLPVQLSKEEVEEIVNDIILKQGATSMADMKNIMAEFKNNFANQADGKLVSEVIRSNLSK